jgi:hypothetical protein
MLAPLCLALVIHTHDPTPGDRALWAEEVGDSRRAGSLRSDSEKTSFLRRYVGISSTSGGWTA